jgi:hypothetical protein
LRTWFPSDGNQTLNAMRPIESELTFCQARRMLSTILYAVPRSSRKVHESSQSGARFARNLFGVLGFTMAFKELRRIFMADTKGKIKEKIDEAAEKAKEVTENVADKAKAATKKVGEKVEKAGEAIKNKGS